MKCGACQEKIEKGESYVLDPYFDKPTCMNCYPELKQHMIESEDWISLHLMETKEILTK